MRDERRLGRVLETERTNAALGWALLALVAGVALASVVDGDFAWAAFCTGVAALAVVPPVVYRAPRVMLPWEVLLVAFLPVLGHALATWWLTTALATYLSVAALALVAVVELDVFTSVRMTDGVAGFVVVVTTMAVAGLWAVVQWLSDIYLHTTLVYVSRPITPAVDAASLDALMWDFIAATVCGVAGAALFVLYFRRRVRAEDRLAEEVLP
ncbi:hypothetical protein GCM10009037_05240 [Halarchaeum grantii]|uniref:Uncharacterized protein n=1 Tax=Halarchaeum grantii TaxID=1193105 RepID=A0A830ESD9_9EURY|nr:hypothetical protein [Halarchaeum grantii]GGL24628.1 hypothetical protein GCM10009037_05240 [Halarchaeum grantii]